MLTEILNTNGLVTWNEEEISDRHYLINYFELKIKDILFNLNRAWSFHRIESSCLIPKEFLNKEYEISDVFSTGLDLILRPETTAASYEYAKYLLKHQINKPPFVVWQAGKSFRIEQDQVIKKMRLKEFYQQEFQCFFSKDTRNDYYGNVLMPIVIMFQKLFHDAFIMPSDRLPSYSLKTNDIMIGEMEICSISLRKDFDHIYSFNTKSGETMQAGLWVLEIAIGLDRCVYQLNK
jgi:glycyl-tRNA synthetase